MPSGRVVTLPGGAVVELDREVDAPIDLYVDGMHFAMGRLLVTDDGALAVRIEDVVGMAPELVGAAAAGANPLTGAGDSAASADEREDLP
jgi:hypothetical protein